MKKYIVAEQDKIDHERGVKIADILGLRPKKDGYFYTYSGRKTYCGLYRTIKTCIETMEKEVKI